MDWKLMFLMMINLFSLNRKSRRFFSFRRIIAVIVLSPIFISTLLLNRFFLLADYIFFPVFIFQKIKSPVFIISLPRTGTTFLLHSLEADKQFSSFKLWELLFAPSIIQKYILIFFFYLDRIFSSPVKKLILMIENLIIKNFRHIHILGLNKPEEDDLILLWNFSTLYFMFFSPELNDYDNYVDFSIMNQSKRKRILNYYYKCVQRHEFVFNRKQQGRFLSKNPLMIPKFPYLLEMFPDMKIITLNRKIEDVIASTISMNEVIYNTFSNGPSSEDWVNKSIDALIQWQILLNAITENMKLNISFENIIHKEKLHIVEELISEHLIIPKKFWLQNEINQSNRTSSHISKHQHFHLSGNQLKKIREQLAASSTIMMHH